MGNSHDMIMVLTQWLDCKGLLRVLISENQVFYNASFEVYVFSKV